MDVMCAGLLVADLFSSPLSCLPRAGELLRVDELLLQTGGCAANAGANLARLGVQVAVVGRVGNDVFADFVRSDLQSKGVDTTQVRVSSTAATSRTVILPVAEDRRYIHNVGANAEFCVADIDLDRVANSRALCVGGYLLLPGIEQAALAELFAFAQRRGVLTVLDVAGPLPGMETLRQVLPYTDVFLPNDDEARILTGEDDPLRQAGALLEAGAGTIVITMGSQGVLARTPREALQAPAFRVPVVDPSGAGDAFAAGFIVGLLEGWDLRRTTEFASAVGASACTKLGCTAGVFTRAEVDAFLAHSHLDFTDARNAGQGPL